MILGILKSTKLVVHCRFYILMCRLETFTNLSISSWIQKLTNATIKISISLERERVASLLCKLDHFSIFAIKRHYHPLTTVLAYSQRIHNLSLIDFRYINFNASGTYLYIFPTRRVARQRPCFINTLSSCSDDDRLQSVALLQLI